MSSILFGFMLFLGACSKTPVPKDSQSEQNNSHGALSKQPDSFKKTEGPAGPETDGLEPHVFQESKLEKRRARIHNNGESNPKGSKTQGEVSITRVNTDPNIVSTDTSKIGDRKEHKSAINANRDDSDANSKEASSSTASSKLMVFIAYSKTYEDKVKPHIGDLEAAGQFAGSCVLDNGECGPDDLTENTDVVAFCPNDDHVDKMKKAVSVLRKNNYSTFLLCTDDAKGAYDIALNLDMAFYYSNNSHSLSDQVYFTQLKPLDLSLETRSIKFEVDREVFNRRTVRRWDSMDTSDLRHLNDILETDYVPEPQANAVKVAEEIVDFVNEKYTDARRKPFELDLKVLSDWNSRSRLNNYDGPASGFKRSELRRVSSQETKRNSKRVLILPDGYVRKYMHTAVLLAKQSQSVVDWYLGLSSYATLWYFDRTNEVQEAISDNKYTHVLVAFPESSQINRYVGGAKAVREALTSLKKWTDDAGTKLILIGPERDTLEEYGNQFDLDHQTLSINERVLYKDSEGGQDISFQQLYKGQLKLAGEILGALDR
ncbi:MAG: hypothetical protein KDD48_09180 [Bdellovibrionales bacterium]|nr:hypothetical protein [Bdellovibrionales bacterium]